MKIEFKFVSTMKQARYIVTENTEITLTIPD